MKLNLINKEDFDKLSINEKRVALAKDVISRINAENFIENNGQILMGDVIHKRTTSPKEDINNNKCEVCARGAVLCSWIGNFNEVTWDTLDNFTPGYIDDFNSDRFPSQLLEVFDPIMLDNMEAAFENESFPWHYDKVETQKYADAFSTYDDEEDMNVGASIITIMEHIIENNGEFPLPEVID